MRSWEERNCSVSSSEASCPPNLPQSLSLFCFFFSKPVLVSTPWVSHLSPSLLAHPVPVCAPESLKQSPRLLSVTISLQSGSIWGSLCKVMCMSVYQCTCPCVGVHVCVSLLLSPGSIPCFCFMSTMTGTRTPVRRNMRLLDCAADTSAMTQGGCEKREAPFCHPYPSETHTKCSSAGISCPDCGVS